MVLFGSFSEDHIFILKPLTLLLTPPDHLTPYLPVDRLARELSVACRARRRPLPHLMFEATQWAAETGPFDFLFEVDRRLLIPFRFCVIMKYYTLDDWDTEYFRVAMRGL